MALSFVETCTYVLNLYIKMWIFMFSDVELLAGRPFWSENSCGGGKRRDQPPGSTYNPPGQNEK